MSGGIGVSLKGLMRLGQAIMKGDEDQCCEMHQVIWKLVTNSLVQMHVGGEQVGMIDWAHMMESQSRSACITNVRWRQQVEYPFKGTEQEG